MPDRQDPDRDQRGRDRSSKLTSKDLDAIHDRIDTQSAKLERSSQLTLMAAKDSGELKAGLQLVIFLAAAASQLVREVVGACNEQKKGVLDGSIAKACHSKFEFITASSIC